MEFDELTVRELLISIAAKTPTPGGGVVASMTAALAAALAQMVVNFSVGKKSLANHDKMHLNALRALSELSTQAIQLAQADAKAYARLNELWKLDKKDDRRRRDFPEAVRGAIEAPRRIQQSALEMLKLMHTLVGTTNSMLKSDLAIAALLAEAASRAAAWNVRINLPLLEDTAQREQPSYGTF